jgi:hypothetical protein
MPSKDQTGKDQAVRKLARLRELLKQAKTEGDRQTLRSAILVLQRTDFHRMDSQRTQAPLAPKGK